MVQCKHTVQMRSIQQSTGVLFSLALLLMLVACGSTPSTQATSSATATPTIPPATPYTNLLDTYYLFSNLYRAYGWCSELAVVG